MSEIDVPETFAGKVVTDETGGNGIGQAANVVAFPRSDEVAESDVERVNHYPLYELGKTLRRLTDALTATADDDLISVRRLYTPFYTSMTVLDNLMNGIPFPLGISKAAARSLRESIRLSFDEHFSYTDKDGKRRVRLPESDVEISTWEVNQIPRELSKFETIFAAEMSELATYFVPSRGIYSTAALIDVADQSFPISIIGHVPEKARLDWRSAGRCLAFSLLSATGFHVARAVEATLEVYYQLYTGKSGTLNSWNDYLKSLDVVVNSNASPAPSDKTMAELRQMKDDYRNPVMHPRVTLSENDARILFDNGESLIIAMAEEIKTIREAGGVQGSLAVVGGSSLDDEIPF